MGIAWLTIANAPKPLWNTRLLWTTLALLALVALGIFIIAWVDRWRKRDSGETISTKDQLSSFRQLYEQGELSQEEFERIQAKLLGHTPAKPAGEPSPGTPSNGPPATT